MPAFKYKAIDRNGIEISGSIEGDTERHVRSILREKKLIPLLIKIINKEKSGKLRFSVSRNTLSGVELAYFTRQFATLIKSGIPIDEALFAINEQNKKQHISDIILTIRSKILEGFTLSSSLADFPQSFPLIYSTTVSAGEQSGHLSLILEKLADFIESKQKLNQQIAGFQTNLSQMKNEKKGT